MRILTHGRKYHQRWYLVECECGQILPFLQDTAEFFCPACATRQGADTLLPDYVYAWKRKHLPNGGIFLADAFWFDELPEDEEWPKLSPEQLSLNL